MTTTNLSTTYGTPYTWSNQALLWSDDLAGLRTWDVSYDTLSYTLTVAEPFALTELCSNGPRLAKSESFAFAEARNAQIGLNPNEAVSFVEAPAMSVAQALDEALAFDDGLANSVTKPLAETVSFAEVRKATVGLNKSEAVAIAELNAFYASQALDEAFSMDDGDDATKAITKALSESFWVAEALGKYVSVAKTEAFAIDDDYQNVVSYVRAFAETMAIAESVSKTYGLKKSEAFAVVDAWRRAADMVISDMMVSTDDMDMAGFEEFLKYGNVPGYEKWRDFIPGDYEYREAMIRIVLESKNDDRGLITNLQATIDVPDLIDRGSATITNAAVGIYVTYNRLFHITPEITLAARGGVANPTAPEFYGTPTKDGFTVRLRDTISGAYVTGTFTWAAHGY